MVLRLQEHTLVLGRLLQSSCWPHLHAEHCSSYRLPYSLPYADPYLCPHQLPHLLPLCHADGVSQFCTHCIPHAYTHQKPD